MPSLLKKLAPSGTRGTSIRSSRTTFTDKFSVQIVQKKTILRRSFAIVESDVYFREECTSTHSTDEMQVEVGERREIF